MSSLLLFVPIFGLYLSCWENGETAVWGLTNVCFSSLGTFNWVINCTRCLFYSWYTSSIQGLFRGIDNRLVIINNYPYIESKIQFQELRWPTIHKNTCQTDISQLYQLILYVSVIHKWYLWLIQHTTIDAYIKHQCTY